MPRGPLPNPQARRRNAPTIPTTQLPAAGRQGDVPDCPYVLRDAGSKWWAWAWKLPQATQWDAGALYVVARRAQLEDEMAALSESEHPDWDELLGIGDERETGERLEWILRKLQSRASGSTTLMREMRELDNRLGLNPKAMADLRWSIAGADDQPEDKPAPLAEVRRLKAVDAAAG